MPPEERYSLNEDALINEIFGEGYSDGSTSNYDPKLVLERGIPRRPGASTLTVGEMKKIIANSTQYKVYSKKNALDVISKMQGVSGLSQKTVSELSDALWQGLNDCADAESRQIRESKRKIIR